MPIEDPTRLARKLPTQARGDCKPILRNRLGLGAGALPPSRNRPIEYLPANSGAWRLFIEPALLQPFYSHGPTAKFAAAVAFLLRHFGVCFARLAAKGSTREVTVA